MYSRILIATDGSELAQKGVAQGVALAKTLGSTVILLTVSEPWTPMGVDAAGLAITEYALADEYEKAAEIAGKAPLGIKYAKTSCNMVELMPRLLEV